MRFPEKAFFIPLQQLTLEIGHRYYAYNIHSKVSPKKKFLCGWYSEYRFAALADRLNDEDTLYSTYAYGTEWGLRYIII